MDADDVLAGLGSIPASAGEPANLPTTTGVDAVYPRECGGTTENVDFGGRGHGLSPRVRGNHQGSHYRAEGDGSIPASAGEPGRCCASRAARRVYPRECGGTAGVVEEALVDDGLSPRVRGNHRRRRASAAARGSIPASAGEPHRDRSVAGGSQVYPRECGGTIFAGRVTPLAEGLSPRVRGNLSRRLMRAPAPGSIPASAGEPPRAIGPSAPAGVYPRECGGTSAAR